MRSRIHLLESENQSSIIVRNKAQEYDPLYLRFEYGNDNEDLQPIDVLIVSKDSNLKLKDSDLCLVYREHEDKYVLDTFKQAVYAEDISYVLNDVFIGHKGNVVPLCNVEKVIASSACSMDSNVPMPSMFTVSKLLFLHNTGNSFSYVDVLTNSDGDALINDDGVVESNFLELELDESEILNIGDLELSVEKGYIVAKTSNDGMTINMSQLTEIFEFISEVLNK